jgi:hypothetical protein
MSSGRRKRIEDGGGKYQSISGLEHKYPSGYLRVNSIDVLWLRSREAAVAEERAFSCQNDNPWVEQLASLTDYAHDAVDASFRHRVVLLLQSRVALRARRHS